MQMPYMLKYDFQHLILKSYQSMFGIKEQIDTITNRYNKWLYLFHISSC